MPVFSQVGDLRNIGHDFKDHSQGEQTLQWTHSEPHMTAQKTHKSSWSWQIQIEDCLPTQISAYPPGSSKEANPQGRIPCWTFPSSVYTGYFNDVAVLDQRVTQTIIKKIGQGEKGA